MNWFKGGIKMGQFIKKRHKKIVEAMRQIGGEASLKEIQRITQMNLNGLSQTMSQIDGRYGIRYVRGGGKNKVFRLED